MPKLSAGLLLYRVRSGRAEILLVHPGGPFWKNKDSGAWSLPEGEFISLGEIKQKGGKIVRAWAFEGDCDPASIKSNTFRMEWPPRSGKVQEFPEIDKAGFFTVTEARKKINPAQVALLDAFERIIERAR